MRRQIRFLAALAALVSLLAAQAGVWAHGCEGMRPAAVLAPPAAPVQAPLAGACEQHCAQATTAPATLDAAGAVHAVPLASPLRVEVPDRHRARADSSPWHEVPFPEPPPAIRFAVLRI